MAAAAAEKDEENAYAAQTAAILRMRGLLEDEATMKKNAMMKAMQEENKRMALEKRQREQAWKDDQAMQDKAEITLTNHHETLDKDGRITRQIIEDRGRFHQIWKQSTSISMNETKEQMMNEWRKSDYSNSAYAQSTNIL